MSNWLEFRRACCLDCDHEKCSVRARTICRRERVFSQPAFACPYGEFSAVETTAEIDFPNQEALAAYYENHASEVPLSRFLQRMSRCKDCPYLKPGLVCPIVCNCSDGKPVLSMGLLLEDIPKRGCMHPGRNGKKGWYK